MEDASKIKLLKSVVSQKRSLEEEKRAVSEEMKGYQKEVEEEIMGDGDIGVAKEKYLKILNKEIERKETNAKIKRTNVALEKIIMGEAEYDDNQLTIEDILDGTAEHLSKLNEDDNVTQIDQIDGKSRAAGE